MRSIRSSLLLTSVLTVAGPLAAFAVPVLQLDIPGGTYDPVNETIVTDSNTFTVYAYATADNHNSAASLLGTTFYLSVALTPETGPAPASLGSFSVNGTPYNVTADMTYGIPPIEANSTAAHDGGDLGGHDVFDTFFREIPFTLTAANQSGEYNTQTDGGHGPIAGTGMYYVAFNVDKTALSSDVQLHFDTYTKVHGQRGTDLDIGIFAPFSHDAGTIPGKPVPEPTAAMVFAIGLGAARFAGRRSS